MRPVLRIALVGFGSVGRRLAERLAGPYGRALRAAGVAPRITGIATARHGLAVDERGLPLARCLAAVRSGRSLGAFHRGPALASVMAFVRRVPADVLVELTPLDPRRGHPAVAHVRASLRNGRDVVTANKGPLAFAYRSLKRLAARQGRLFLYEAAVMDGAPIFNLVERCLPGARVLGFRGTLNSTTSLVLDRIEQGATPSAAVREAQAMGIAEADPRHDLDGWDAAVKIAALAIVLMGVPVKLGQVKRAGIRELSEEKIRSVRAAGMRYKLVCRAERRGDRLECGVGPELLLASDPLAGLEGTSSALKFDMDVFGLSLVEHNPGIEATGYGMLADFLRAVRLF